MENNFDHLIEAYLDGSLSAEQRTAFEKNLQSDPELAARVALERELADALADSPENRLLHNLQNIAGRFDTPESLEFEQPPAASPEKTGIWPWIAGALLVVLVCFFAFFNPAQQNPPNQHPDAQPQPGGAQSVPQPAPDKTPEAPVQRPAPEPIAAAFKKMPALEEQIGSRFRGGDFELRVSSPADNSTLPLQDEKVHFKLSGVCEGSIPAAGIMLNILIFNNKTSDYENMRPVARQNFRIDRGKPDFQWAAKLALQPGLYYVVVEEKESGDRLWISRFSAK